MFSESEDEKKTIHTLSCDSEFPENILTIEQIKYLYRYLPVLASNKETEFSFGDGTMLNHDMDGNEPFYTMEQQYHSSEIDLSSFDDTKNFMFTVNDTTDLSVKNIMDMTQQSVDLIVGGEPTKYLESLIDTVSTSTSTSGD